MVRCGLPESGAALKGPVAAMMEFIDFVVRPQFLVTFFASISAFATVLTIVLPMLDRDRTSQDRKSVV